MNQKNIIQNSAALFKILGDETRLSILSLLSKEEANVSTIVNKLGGEQSNVSHQLKILKDHEQIKKDIREILFPYNLTHSTIEIIVDEKGILSKQ